MAENSDSLIRKYKINCKCVTLRNEETQTSADGYWSSHYIRAIDAVAQGECNNRHFRSRKAAITVTKLQALDSCRNMLRTSSERLLSPKASDWTRARTRTFTRSGTSPTAAARVCAPVERAWTFSTSNAAIYQGVSLVRRAGSAPARRIIWAGISRIRLEILAKEPSTPDSAHN